MPVNTTVISPALLSDIFGAAQIGDPVIEVKEFGEAGSFPIGCVVSLIGIGNAPGKIVRTSNATIAGVYGIIAEDRIIVDIDSERSPHAHVIRHGSFKADALTIADDTSLTAVEGRLRELGIYLEGLAMSVAPPFRIRRVSPNIAEVNTVDLRIDVFVDGSVDDSARIWWNNVLQVSSVVLDFSHLWCTIPDTGATVRVVPVQVRQGTWISNTINFAVVPAVVAPPPPPPPPPPLEAPPAPVRRTTR